MSQYEIWSLIFSFINILLFFYISYSFQKNFSNENKIKEMLSLKLNSLIKLTEILNYSEEERNDYLVNKRKISNVLYNISRKKIYKYIPETNIRDLKSNFDLLTFSLESNDKMDIGYKEKIYSKIDEIQYLLYNLK
ncbi:MULTISPECIES: hypothetical protein [Fusobacterium]|uniref:Uncharacterized protein n=2 Tax=Fusobacterium nucleatum subsp. polymorphum TaxID=76857 RepID=A0A2C6AVZ4_FUSNP|nr:MULTISPECIES: hypothetical protein [Fusobacterium]EUB15691.1 hypothetical protein HMPREF1500_1012 [Fusobacterium sp. CM22]PHH98395.1 hypothetical protein CA836_00680 [Fusobacterium polymorphum]PIM74620.1 hypothetical protein CTM65_00510 [Fusobacterium polymorphum]